MGDLRKQLEQAKLLSKKRARQLAHEQRVQRKQVGRTGLEDAQQRRQAELRRQQSEARARDRQAQQALEVERRAAAERAACVDILRHDVVRPGRGPQRWYFQLEDGSLPWLGVDESMGHRLQNGAYWVVRLGPPGSHTYGLLDPAHGERVLAAIPERVVWAPGRPRHGPS